MSCVVESVVVSGVSVVVSVVVSVENVVVSVVVSVENVVVSVVVSVILSTRREGRQLHTLTPNSRKNCSASFVKNLFTDDLETVWSSCYI